MVRTATSRSKSDSIRLFPSRTFWRKVWMRCRWPSSGSSYFCRDEPLIQVLTFHQPLHGVQIRTQLGIQIAILHQQIVLQRNKESRAPRIALPPRAAPKLIVDAAAFVFLRADHVQSARFRRPLPEPDIGAPARHVGGNGHRAALARARDDARFQFVIPGVKHPMRNVAQKRA